MSEEYEDDQCLDRDGEPYPEHDYDHSGECTRCGAVADGWDE